MRWTDDRAVAYLQRCGWTLTPQWCWRRPAFAHVVSMREYSAIDYLANEWDFGGIER
jgi:hypothetical protein